MELSALEMVSLTHPQYGETPSGLWSEGWPQTAREFERLIDVFGARLVRYACRRLGNLHDAEECVESQRLNLDRAKEALRLAEVGYKQETNTQTEVVDARTALVKARSLYYQAVYSHVMGRLNLQKALGTLGPGGAESPETAEDDAVREGDKRQ